MIPPNPFFAGFLDRFCEIPDPVLRQYERNTFYDRNGRIVYLDGDSMYGFRTPEWKEIKDMKEGNVTRTIQDDTLPGGPREGDHLPRPLRLPQPRGRLRRSLGLLRKGEGMREGA